MRVGSIPLPMMKGAHMSEPETGPEAPKPEEKIVPDRYLGDGTYGSYDGYQIWLDTRAQVPVNRIAIDAHVFRNLVDYVAEIEAAVKAHAEKAAKPE